MAADALDALEFHRTGFGLLPEGTDPDPGLAVQAVLPTGVDRPHRSCSCKSGKRRTCSHVKRLAQLRGELESRFDALAGVGLPDRGSASRAVLLVTETLLFAGESWRGEPSFRL